jgi:MFS family permease
MLGLGSFRPAGSILIGAAVMLSLGMGVRQSLGLFMPPLTRDLPVSVTDFTLAVAIQNLAWGALQPIAGAWVVRLGFRPVMVAGAALYAAGLATLASAQGALGVSIGAGVLIGLALACTASAIAMAVASRAVSAAARSTVLGMVTAAGSVGALVAAPIGQGLAEELGWRAGVLGFLALALAMLPAAWLAGGVDRLTPRAAGADGAEPSSACVALLGSLKHVPFVVMSRPISCAGCSSCSSRRICRPISRCVTWTRC